VEPAGLRWGAERRLYPEFLENSNVQEAPVARRKQAWEQAQITVWPSSFPDQVSTDAGANEDLSRDCDELGNRFMSDRVEPTHSAEHWDPEAEDDEPYFDAKMGDALLREFGLEPMPRRATRSSRLAPPATTTRPLLGPRAPLPKLTAPRMPKDLDEYFMPLDELDLTEETIRDVSLMDHEGDEAGEVESPSLCTEDVHTHGKRRGGHARSSLRPPKR
jgi:hypothetical protein